MTHPLISIVAVVIIVYVCIALILLIVIPYKVAKPPWHYPTPGQPLTTRSLPPAWDSATTPAHHDLPYHSVTIPTAAYTLRAWLIPAHRSGVESTSSVVTSNVAPSPSSQPNAASTTTIVCVHGAGRDRRAFLRHSTFLRDLGDVLLFDCASHGSSDMASGPPVTLGRREAEDVTAVVSFARARSRHVGIVATSQGAVATILAVAGGAHVQALVLENAFVSPRALVNGIIHAVLQRSVIRALRLEWMTIPTCLAALVMTGNVTAGKNAVKAVREIEAPMLFVHGEKDAIVAVEQSVTLHRAACASDASDASDTGAEHMLWIVQGAGHTLCYDAAPAEFERRVVQFLRRALLSGERS